MPNKLINLEVQFISLVEAGANQKQIIWKSQDNREQTWWREVPIRKTVEEKKIVYGIVYAPDEVDSQGDYATAEVIEQAAYNFMKSLRLWQVDKDHNFEPEAAFVAESWLIRPPDSLFPEEKAGAWAVAIKIEDEDLWARIKGGAYRALSLAGYAERVNVEKAKAPEDIPWDFRAADYTVAQLARACAWVKGVADPHKGKLPEDLTKGDCKLPHHNPEGTVILRGVMAAGAAIQGARGGVDIPEDDLSRVKSHLAADDHECERQAPWETEKAETIFHKFKNWLTKSQEGEDDSMTPEEIQKAIDAALAPLTGKLEALEKRESLTKADLEVAIGEAVEKVVKPLQEDMEALKKTSPGSKQDNEPISREDEDKIVANIVKFTRREG